METLTKERKTIEVMRGVKSENLSKEVNAAKPKENPSVTIAKDVKVSSELEKKKAMLKKAELDLEDLNQELMRAKDYDRENPKLSKQRTWNAPAQEVKPADIKKEVKPADIKKEVQPVDIKKEVIVDEKNQSKEVPKPA